MYLLTAPLFGGKHMLGLLAIVLVNVILAIVFKRYIKTERRFLIVTMTVFYVLEVLKLGYMIVRDGSFPMHHLPLQLCSVPLYVYLLWFLTKPDSWWHNAAKATAYSVVLIAAIAALVMPVNIIGKETTWALVEDNYLPYVSFAYHGFMIFASWYVVKAGYVKVSIQQAKDAIGLVSILMGVAILFNTINGSDFMLLNEGKGSPLVFLRDISPLLYSVSMIVLGYVAITLTFAIGSLVTRKSA